MIELLNNMGMETRRSNGSPHSSDHQTATWISQVNQYDCEDSSLSGLNIEVNKELSSLIEDKDIASKAVAFVVHSTRKGIVPLCADVANLLRSKKQLQDKLARYKRDNERLLNGLSVNSTISPVSPHTSVSYSDKTSESNQINDQLYNHRRCSESTTSFSSSNLSASPKLGKYKQRSPRLHRTSAFTLPNHSSPSPNQHLAVATVHYNPPNGTYTEVGHKSKGHERKDSLPQIVSVPQANIPKIIPKVRSEDKEIQCDLLTPEQNERLEKQFKTTMKFNSTLSEELGAAKKEIEILRGKLKELEMTQLARQCMDDFHVENECDKGKSKRKTSSPQPTCTKADKNPFQGIPLPKRKGLLKLEGTMDSCRCVNCDVTRKEISGGVKSKRKIICDSELREELGVSINDHVVVKGDRTGYVRYIGHLDNVGQPSAIYVGLELDAPVGRHDGIFNGKRYFSCQSDHGVMLPPSDVVCLISEKEPSACHSYKSATSCGSAASITSIHIGADGMPVDNPPQLTSENPSTLAVKEVENTMLDEGSGAKIQTERLSHRAEKSRDKEKIGRNVKKKECKIGKFFRRKDLTGANEKRYPTTSHSNLRLPRVAPAVAEDVV